MAAPRRPGRPRGSRAGETREALLAIAASVFSETGFRGSSLGQVAERAGLSTPALLHHFGSKKALLAEVLRYRDRVARERLVATREEPVGFEVVEGLLELVRFNAQHPAMVRLYSTMSGEGIDGDHPGHDWLQEHMAHVRGELVASLRRGLDAGTVRPDAPVEVIAQVVVAVLDGLQVQWLLQPEDVDMVAGADEMLTALRCRWELPPQDG